MVRKAQEVQGGSRGSKGSTGSRGFKSFKGFKRFKGFKQVQEGSTGSGVQKFRFENATVNLLNVVNGVKDADDHVKRVQTGLGRRLTARDARWYKRPPSNSSEAAPLTNEAPPR
jgi:hypothetical protein